MTQNRSLVEPLDGRRSAFACALICVVLLSAIGCGSTTQSQVTRLQAEKKELLNRIVDEQKRSETLTAELRDANLRVAEAEKQLARLVDDPRSRYAGAGVNSLPPYSSAFRAAGSSSGSPPSASPLNAGAPVNDSPPPARPQIGLGAPRDAGRDDRSSATANPASPLSPRSFSNRGGTDGTDGPGVDLSGPRNGAAPGWIPKSR